MISELSPDYKINLLSLKDTVLILTSKIEVYTLNGDKMQLHNKYEVNISSQTCMALHENFQAWP